MLFALILFPLIAWSGGKGDPTLKAIQDRYLVPGLVFEKSYEEEREGDQKAKIFLFTAKKRGISGFEILKRALELKGFVFQEWDREGAKAAREAVGRLRTESAGKLEKKERPVDPVEIETYRSAAAFKEEGSDRALIVISSHLFDSASGKWIERANVQVIVRSTPSPRPVPDGTGPRLPGRSR